MDRCQVNSPDNEIS